TPGQPNTESKTSQQSPSPVPFVSTGDWRLATGDWRLATVFLAEFGGADGDADDLGLALAPDLGFHRVARPGLADFGGDHGAVFEDLIIDPGDDVSRQQSGFLRRAVGVDIVDEEA